MVRERRMAARMRQSAGQLLASLWRFGASEGVTKNIQHAGAERMRSSSASMWLRSMLATTGHVSSLAQRDKVWKSNHFFFCRMPENVIESKRMFTTVFSHPDWTRPSTSTREMTPGTRFNRSCSSSSSDMIDTNTADIDITGQTGKQLHRQFIKGRNRARRIRSREKFKVVRMQQK